MSEIHGLKHSGGVINGSYSAYCSKYAMQLQRAISRLTDSSSSSSSSKGRNFIGDICNADIITELVSIDEGSSSISLSEGSCVLNDAMLDFRAVFVRYVLFLHCCFFTLSVFNAQKSLINK